MNNRLSLGAAPPAHPLARLRGRLYRAVKRDFVLSVLHQKPDASLDQINRRWTGAGNTGQISRSTVELALRMMPVSAEVTGAEVSPGDTSSFRRRMMLALEEDLDRVVLSAMNIGGLEYVTKLAREARRALIIQTEREEVNS